MSLPLRWSQWGLFQACAIWTHRMRAETSICLHDCLDFIALGELLLSQALPLKKTIFGSELALGRLRRSEECGTNRNAAAETRRGSKWW